ncbi:glycosyltransferase [Sinomicrobium pectinilyticum]|uniref:Glycosyltransferase n=1 Tax=Sinomicrobium pectinilyticum TaxID=1084421 RepID=A0A3N0EH77_SINP1|nr:glycosyltransferase [Sinomicrobium pectinilyticum]RNL87233.1 glycosyltransferase [Sinomicrobium pectinilyticum]
MNFVIIGLSVTSSWGNGHATTYRALLRELSSLGHDILFLEKDVPYYASNRDMARPEFCKLGLYKDNWELKERYESEVVNADVVIVGSYVSNGVDVGKWVTEKAKGIKAFYDIDTPVTISKLGKRDYEYIHPELIRKYDIYLSFSGGGILEYIEKHYHSPKARPLYCSVDPDIYFPKDEEIKWQMGYLGTYSIDRQPTIHRLLNKPAAFFPEGKFVVVGPQYPKDFKWSENVERIEHLPPTKHRKFYNAQKFTLNVTREAMIKVGYSPSVRLFEAAACGVPIISDFWKGIDSIFEIDKEILIAKAASDVLKYFESIGEEERKQIGTNARRKVLKHHTAKTRAKELESYINEIYEPSKM